MGYKKISEFSLNKTNPFAEETLIKLSGCTATKTVLSINKDESRSVMGITKDGQSVAGAFSYLRQKLVDEEQFTKVYIENFAMFFDLKKSTMKLLYYVMRQLIPNKDQFVFILDECKEFTGLGTTSIYRGLAELCNKKIIARGINDCFYFINPSVLFNGNRVVFAMEFIKNNYPEHNDITIASVPSAIKQITNNTDNADNPLLSED